MSWQESLLRPWIVRASLIRVYKFHNNFMYLVLTGYYLCKSFCNHDENYFYVIYTLASHADVLCGRSLGLSRNDGERLCDKPKGWACHAIREKIMWQAQRVDLSDNEEERLCDKLKDSLLGKHSSLCHRPGNSQGKISSMSGKNEGILCWVKGNWLCVGKLGKIEII